MNDLSGVKVLITGGLGMIGSTIVKILHNHKASITILDAQLEPYGFNLFNVKEIKNEIRNMHGDIRDYNIVKAAIEGQDVIFNLAGQVSHNDSLSNPILDAEINYLGHINVLEALKKTKQDSVVIHTGSRLQYGVIKSVPVSEVHPVKPLTPYAVNKSSAENVYSYYNRVHGIPCILFRISNPYGPRSQMKHNKYSMVNWFIRQAMENKTISIFGDGNQIRDFIYVEDLADGITRSAFEHKCYGRVFNIGSGKGTTFKKMVEEVVKTVGQGKIQHIPWPKDYLNIETGDYISDISSLKAAINWYPQTELVDGLKKTVEYYNKYKTHYW